MVSIYRRNKKPVLKTFEDSLESVSNELVQLQMKPIDIENVLGLIAEDPYKRKYSIPSKKKRRNWLINQWRDYRKKTNDDLP